MKIKKRILKVNDYWHPEFFAIIPVIIYICWILWKIYENTK